MGSGRPFPALFPSGGAAAHYVALLEGAYSANHGFITRCHRTSRCAIAANHSVRMPVPCLATTAHSHHQHNNKEVEYCGGRRWLLPPLRTWRVFLHRRLPVLFEIAHIAALSAGVNPSPPLGLALGWLLFFPIACSALLCISQYSQLQVRERRGCYEGPKGVRGLREDYEGGKVWKKLRLKPGQVKELLGNDKYTEAVLAAKGEVMVLFGPG